MKRGCLVISLCLLWKIEGLALMKWVVNTTIIYDTVDLTLNSEAALDSVLFKTVFIILNFSNAMTSFTMQVTVVLGTVSFFY